MNMPSKNPSRRRIKLINRDFQIGLMIKFFLANAAILALFGAILFLFLRGEVESNLRSAHVTYKTVGAMLFPIILTLSLLILAILSVTTVYVILHASHRIAGPMYRFNQVLTEMQGRNLKAMTKIRTDDQLAEISASLERVRDLWAGDVGRLRKLVDDLRAALPMDTPGDDARRKLADMQFVLDSYGV
jgi:ABC-type multidrug transport system fused ATPase/permease subunit